MSCPTYRNPALSSGRAWALVNKAWSQNARHMLAKEKGKSMWFKNYVTRIAKVESVY